jgi:uncharacterized protein YhdP
MSKPKVLLLWLAVSLGTILVLLVVSSLLLPHVLDLNPMKKTVSTEIEQKLGVRVEFSRLQY